MAKYIHNKHILEAVQWWDVGDHPDVTQVGSALNIDPPYQYCLKTPLGDLLIKPGDWIVRGIDGNNYLVGQHHFEAHYHLYPDVDKDDLEKLIRRLSVEHCYIAPSDVAMARKHLTQMQDFLHG